MEVALLSKHAQMTCLLALGKFLNTVSGLMQWALPTVEVRCNEVGLSVNPDKTGLVTFTRKRKLQGFFKPQLFGVKLSLCVGQVSGCYSGFSIDLDRTGRGQSEEGS